LQVLYLLQALEEEGVNRKAVEAFSKFLKVLQAYHTQEAENTASAATSSQIPDTEKGGKPVKAKVKGVSSGKKYKPVDKKVRPIYGISPEDFRIIREIKGNMLANLQPLPEKPPEFTPTGRYTQERKEWFDKAHPGFWWVEERKLIHYFMMIQNEAFAWEESERGRLKPEYFKPIKIATIPHKPWVERQGPIAPFLFEPLCEMMRSKINAGVWEPSNSSYRSRWFCVLKKDGKSLRIVHSLEPLNAVTIAHSGLPPNVEELASRFAGLACGTTMDLYVGYDERELDESSRDLTTFQTPFGAMRLVTLPMGWTNSVPIFHDDIVTILQDEIPQWTEPYIDDVHIKGPRSRYQRADGTYETIPGNPGIRRFVWEHINTVHRIVERMKYCGGTFSGKKTNLCREEFTVVGHLVSYQGRKPSHDRMNSIRKWGPCKDLSELRAFLGTVGTFRIFVKDYAARAEPLQRLTRKNVPFKWGEEQDKAQADLKQALENAPLLKSIDTTSGQPIKLSVDTSYIAVGWYISQRDREDEKKWNYIRFGSTLLNETEANYSQPKRELYGLVRALKENEPYLIMARPLVVEMDAKYVKGMLQNPGAAPNATINRWIEHVHKYSFDLVHVAGKAFALADGLSRRPRQPKDSPRVEFEDLQDIDTGEGITYSKKYTTDPDPLEFDEFKYEIDTRGGYLQQITNPTSMGTDEPFEAFAIDVYDRFALTNAESERFIEQCHGSSTVDILEISTEQATDLLIDDQETEDYTLVPRSAQAQKLDAWIPNVIAWLRNPETPLDLIDIKDHDGFERFAAKFMMSTDGRLFRREDGQGHHQLYIEPDRRMAILRGAHDANGHRGAYATRVFASKRFWWPELTSDTEWYVKTCLICQQRQKLLVKIPPTVTETPSIFQTVHIDTMHMTPPSNGYKYIVHGRCALTSWMEGRPLRKENAASIGSWLFSDIICRWGCLRTIVTDNGSAMIAAVRWLEEKYGIRGISISGYNSKANGRIERPHWDIRQSLYKVTGGNENRWYWFFDHVMWADRITVRKRLGCSPFFLITGAEPVTPLDIQEATWLVEPPTGIISTEDLIASRARALAKHQTHVEFAMRRVDTEKRQRVAEFERANASTIKNWNFKRGDLVLMRNTAIESSLNSKMKARYLGPMIVVARNRGGAYILAEMDGSVYQSKVAAFRVVPYYARKAISLKDIPGFGFDVTEAQIKDLEESEDNGENHRVDLNFEGMPSLKVQDKAIDDEN